MHKCDTCGAPVRVKGEVPAGAKLRCPKCAASAKAAAPAAPPPAVAAAPAGGASRRPAAASAAGGASAGARPAATAARAPARASAPAPEPAERPRGRSRAAAPGLDKVQKIGLMVAGGVLVLCVIVVMAVKSKRDGIREATEAYQAKVQAVVKQVKEADYTKAANAQHIIDLVNDAEKWANEHEDWLAIEKGRTMARDALNTLKANQETTDRLAALENKFKDPNRTSQSLEEIRRDMNTEELVGKAQTVGKELGDRALKLKQDVENSYAEQLLKDADAMAATPGRERDALRLYGRAEEETRKTVDAAHKSKDKAAIELYVKTYEKIIEGYDAVAEKLFNNKGVDELPWTDFLSGPEATKWNPSKNVEGFTARVVSGALEITGANADVKKIGVVSIGDLTPWRDFELEMDFTMEKGAVDILFHLGATTNQYVKAEPLGVDATKDAPNPNLQRGKPYKLKVIWIGSTAIFRLTGDNAPEGKKIKMGWQFYRRGAIGFQVEPTTRMRVTKFRVKDYK